MKIVVTHTSPDMDAITSVWLIKKFLPNWSDAQVKFVPAGERIDSGKWNPSASLRARNGKEISPIEIIEDNETIHVDTGMGPLDHHQTPDTNVCGASLTWDYVRSMNHELRIKNEAKTKDKVEAVTRMVKVVVDVDHFKEVFRKDPLADYHEFDLAGILDGLKFQFPNQDDYYVEFVSKGLDAVLHEFENRIWAEKEIAANGQEFDTRFGKGIGFETLNDSVIKLAQKMGYAIVLRKDPRKGYVRIKAVPSQNQKSKIKNQKDIDLTSVYEKLKELDPNATWFLHISKKMLLNGSVKNPKMRASKLSLSEIIGVLEKI